MPERLLTVPQAAEMLGLAVITVRKMVSARQIPFVKLNSSVRFVPEQIAAWIEERSVKPLNSKRS